MKGGSFSDGVPRNVSNSTRRLNPQHYGALDILAPGAESSQVVKAAVGKRIRQSDKPLLNKLETAFQNYLKATLPPHVRLRPQDKRYRLGNGIWYKPDFTAVVAGRETAWEVKGPHAFRGGFENLKVAAHQWPEVRFVLAWRVDGRWLEQEVLP